MMLRKLLFIFGFLLLCGFHQFNSAYYNDYPTLPIGASAPDFSLPGIDGKTYTLSSFKDARILIIIFTCNHCPTAQSYEERIIKLADDYKDKGVALVAVNPNDPQALRPDELDFSDIGDSFEEMKIRAKERHFNFPYLYDGQTEKMSMAYGPVATPHVFIFDKERKLRYQGRFDDEDRHAKTPHVLDTRNAVEELLHGKEVNVKTTKVFGCSVKWSDKKNWIEKAKESWAKEVVRLDTIDENGLKDLMKNNSSKLRMINLWATWCGPCVVEFPDLVTINRMYRDRDFEFISVSADAMDKKDKAFDFLKRQEASSPNYIFMTDNKYKLIEAVDPNWQGALPYTILVEPGGKIVYSKEGAIDPAELKRTIIDNHMIGRYY
ncbi:MAG TPA: redoxin family protein [Puia sp.]|nr:redoxin family protein [Puia sp.]